MKLIKRDYWIIGFFILLQILVIVKNIDTHHYINFFWFCDFVLILFAIGFFLKNDQFIKGLINIGFIPQIISIVSLSAAIFFGLNFVGFADILNYSKFYITISFLVHLLSVNVALILTYKIKPKKESLLYSLLFLAIIFVLGLIFTPVDQNINYIYNADFLKVTIPYYTYFCIVLSFIFVILPTYAIQYFLYKISLRFIKIKSVN
jgi:hypothetical protein